MPKETPIEELARIVASGFDDTATKQDVGELRADVTEGFAAVNATLNRIENRLSNIEDRILADYGGRISRIEERLKMKKAA